jgi:hypothetical protein
MHRILPLATVRSRSLFFQVQLYKFFIDNIQRCDDDDDQQTAGDECRPRAQGVHYHTAKEITNGGCSGHKQGKHAHHTAAKSIFGIMLYIRVCRRIKCHDGKSRYPDEKGRK